MGRSNFKELFPSFISITTLIVTLLGVFISFYTNIFTVFSNKELTIVVSGRVYDSGANPLPGVTVFIENQSIQSKSNKDGYFSFKINAVENEKARFFYVKEGYEVEQQEIKITEDIVSANSIMTKNKTYYFDSLRVESIY